MKGETDAENHADATEPSSRAGAELETTKGTASTEAKHASAAETSRVTAIGDVRKMMEDPKMFRGHSNERVPTAWKRKLGTTI